MVSWPFLLDLKDLRSTILGTTCIFILLEKALYCPNAGAFAVIVAVPAFKAVMFPLDLPILATFLLEDEKVTFERTPETVNFTVSPTEILLLFLIENSGSEGFCPTFLIKKPTDLETLFPLDIHLFPLYTWRLYLTQG